jgi:hypothetical protein
MVLYVSNEFFHLILIILIFIMYVHEFFAIVPHIASVYPIDDPLFRNSLEQFNE